MNEYLKEIIILCGIEKPMTSHVARHTFATTVALQNSVPIQTVSKILGHNSIRTTQIYAKIMDTKVSKDMTVLDNVLLGIEQSADELTEFFSQEPFISFINTLPQGLGTLVGEEGVNLSGGQKQWVGFMRAFYNRPQLLLLDESTSAMDAYSEGQILKLLQKCRPEMGIIYVSHRLHTLPKICDRIYILEKGNLAACGSHRELLITDNMYSRFWNDLAAEVL
ncbi:tyrosine-type recombinase/integrase [Dyadobacter jiangsuensis]|uniref:ABC transporter family protein n=1 Tax=Dyadobacter jiangsuensis TaxID=1591085 RepID=A0A2P8FGG5_9BACT|nr:tyrosine-type recombinase/integrase [Dyadobacter jiangsuensis]PSL20815.1 ABC transporter family protein [Dyadobacter jiangsuensis]